MGRWKRSPAASHKRPYVRCRTIALQSLLVHISEVVALSGCVIHHAHTHARPLPPRHPPPPYNVLSCALGNVRSLVLYYSIRSGSFSYSKKKRTC